jgi:hypothetical protein
VTAASVRRFVATAAVLLAITGCSSSNRSEGDIPATVPDNVTSSASSGSCPFSGSTQPQSQAGSGGATTLTKANPSTAGCIDNVQLNFSPTLAASTTAYKTSASTGSAVLVVQLQNTSLGSGMSTGSTTNAQGLNYVQDIDVAKTPNGISISITLDKKRPFLVNSSQVPAELELAIG